MAKHYVKPGISVGTGAGTIGDPWDMQTTYSLANTNGIAAYDVILAMTNGVDVYAPTAALYAPINNCSLGICDYSGNPTRNRAVIDCTGFVGAGITLNNYNVLFGHEFDTPSSYGINTNNGDGHLIAWNKVSDAGNYGIFGNTSTRHVLYAYNTIIDCTTAGIWHVEGIYSSMALGNFIDMDGIGIIMDAGHCVGNLTVMDFTAGTGIGINRLPSARPGFDAMNLIACRTAGGGNTAGTIRAISYDAGQSGDKLILMNTALDLLNSGAGSGVFAQLIGDAGMVLGNIAISDNDFGTNNAQFFETLSHLDPNVVDHNGQDFRPQENLELISYMLKKASEAVGTYLPGGLPVAAAPGAIQPGAFENGLWR